MYTYLGYGHINAIKFSSDALILYLQIRLQKYMDKSCKPLNINYMNNKLFL